ncbi:L-asparaginase [Paenibacillus sp. BIHB 4019]|uniref:asparaginase n=1 Tax=Paenibacillus sp. BIHB 4019 TaxID=1870819 RepID=A0A1B2DFM1_9BACL|nr:asparaginase [Paenibacillus sp. BIHB 4019]ANY66511.1 L-asparaginase [Paenibacillus sp. BIHB 4019]
MMLSIKRMTVFSLSAIIALVTFISPVGAAEAAIQAIAFPEVPASFQKSKLPNILVIGTGGTIAGQSTDETSFQTYRAGTLLIKDMVKSLPNLDKMADVETVQFGNKGSSAYLMDDLASLSMTVDAALKKYDGVVVTTGTDTMEEIGYFLDLTVRSSKPVVITGSMRPWTVIGSDAPANLFNAIKLAASGKTKKFGTVLMLNDEIHAVREVTKTNALRLDTFESPGFGPLGYIDESIIQIYRVPTRALKTDAEWVTPFDLSKLPKAGFSKVEIAYSYQGAGGEAIKGFVDGGAKGIVTAGTGAGGISAAMREERTKAIEKGVVFVTTTRTGSGNIYGGSDGILAGDNLNASHARILLMLTLTYTSDFPTMQKWFTTYGALEVPENTTVKAAA